MTAAAQLDMFLADEAIEIIRAKMESAFAANLSDVERSVLSALHTGGAYGKHMIISTDDMHAKWRSRGEKVHDRRAVRAAIKTLLEVYDLPIGSSRTPGDNGYWFIISDDEAEDASRHLRNEIFSLFRRLKVINPRSKFVRELQGQVQLLESEAADSVD